MNAITLSKGVDVSPKASTKADTILVLLRGGAHSISDIARLANTTAGTVRTCIAKFRRRNVNLGAWEERKDVLSKKAPRLHNPAMTLRLPESTLEYLRTIAINKDIDVKQIAENILTCVAEDDLYSAVTEK